MLILVYLSVGRKDIMKISYTVFNVFKSARLQDKALYRRSLYRLWDCTGGGLFGRTGGRRTAYFKKDPRITYSQKGATASARTIWAAKLRLAEAAELPSEASCARCGKQSLPPRFTTRA
jgi:hypothetical protein